MFQKALKAQTTIINPVYVSDYQFMGSNAKSSNIKFLRSMIQNPQPTEDPKSAFHLSYVFLLVKSSRASSFSFWDSNICSAMKEFHDEYKKFTADWHCANGYKDYYKHYVQHNEVQKLCMEENSKILETAEL
ncbi:hypothetical protein BY996DRAFT_6408877 [Phakopsora pachyrhizi]|nr:hypothetical protein BY996DRAFT_6408877 [Phakopsora pachyrhizi]